MKDYENLKCSECGLELPRGTMYVGVQYRMKGEARKLMPSQNYCALCEPKFWTKKGRTKKKRVLK